MSLTPAERDKVLAIADKLNDKDKAALAAAVLSDVDPTLPVLESFFDHLSDTVHNELIGRATDREDK